MNPVLKRRIIVLLVNANNELICNEINIAQRLLKDAIEKINEGKVMLPPESIPFILQDLIIRYLPLILIVTVIVTVVFIGYNKDDKKPKKKKESKYPDFEMDLRH
jgi:hypothetical protein